MKKIILILLLNTVILYAHKNNDHVSLKIRTGLTFSGISSYNFHFITSKSGSSFYTVYPGYLIGMGIEYESIINFYSASLGIALEMSYGKATTGFIDFVNDETKFETTSLPVLAWIIFKTEGKIVPFLKIGIGGENSTFSEVRKNNAEYDINLNDWFFSWGIGAGIDFNLFKYIRLSAFMENIVKERWFDRTLNNGIKINYGSRNSTTLLGLQFSFIL